MHTIVTVRIDNPTPMMQTDPAPDPSLDRSADDATAAAAGLAGPPEAPAEAADELTAAFEALVQRLAGFAELNAEYTDGFLTALACAPRRPATDQWLPWLCDDAFERCCSDEADAAAARAVFERWLERLAQQLDAQQLADEPDQLQLTPYITEWDDAARAEERAAGATEQDLAWLHTGTAWAGGVIDGLQRVAEAQPILLNRHDSEAFDDCLQRLDVLAQPVGSEDYEAHLRRRWSGRRVSRDLLIDSALLALQTLRMVWLEASLRPEPVSAGPKVGRNDPCPCGSGRKFKKCHGA